MAPHESRCGREALQPRVGRVHVRGARLAPVALRWVALLLGQFLASAVLRPPRVARPHVSLAFTVISLTALMVGSSPNVAVGKSASESIQFSSINPASRAVDNITTCETPNIGDLLAISNPGSSNWWMVDLGAAYVVEHVAVFGRGPTWAPQSDNLQLRVGSSSVNGGASNAVCGAIFSAPTGVSDGAPPGSIGAFVSAACEGVTPLPVG